MLLKLVTVIGTVTTEPGVQVDALPKFTEIWALATIEYNMDAMVRNVNIGFEINPEKAEQTIRG